MRFALLLAAAVAAGSAAAGGNDTPKSPAYVFGAADFVRSYEIPAAGTYELPVIDAVTDHSLVDAGGKATTLAKLTGGRLSIVSFIYGTCGERAGCPLSTAVLHRLDSHITGNADLAANVALVTISFDPERDAARLASMQEHRASGSTWQFVTAPSEALLTRLLADFGQSVFKLRAADGTWTGEFRHVLKVFLLDRELRVRNIYSAGYLDDALIRNDLATLRMGESQNSGTGTDFAKPK